MRCTPLFFILLLLGCTPTIVVDSPSVVFVEPSEAQIEERKRLVGAEDFRIGADDYAWYINESLSLLEARGAKVIRVKGKQVVRFVGRKGTQLLRTDSLDELWTFYFFRPDRPPRVADMTMMEEAYNAYFNH